MTPNDDEATIPLSETKGEGSAHAPSETHDEQTLISNRAKVELESPTRRIGRYRILSELGQGGQGAVYLAEDERMRRRVALKVLFGGLVHSSQARLRFEREAEATGRLNHAGIAKIYEMGESDGIPYIAMELVEGRTLADCVVASRSAQDLNAPGAVPLDLQAAEEPAPAESPSSASSSKSSKNRSSGEKSLRQIARFMEATARAMHLAHESGLIHRDLKPANIMVRPDGTPCILDFGLAHDAASTGMTLTGSNDMFGTPSYMAPEQVCGKTREIDRRTDVWALGATLYECCTLTRPFVAPTRDRLFHQIMSEEPRTPRTLNPTVPKDLEAIILTALDKDQNRRFASAEDLAEDLRRYCEFEPVRARPAGSVLRAIRWTQRNRLVTATASIVMLSVLAAAVIFFVKGAEARAALDEKSKALVAETLEREAKDAALKEKSNALELAERERNAKQVALEDYDRLADVKRLEAAIAAAEPLFPPSPKLVHAIEAWQLQHSSLLDRLPGHRAYLDEVRRTALIYTEEERTRDFAPERAKVQDMEFELSQMKAMHEEAVDEETRSTLVNLMASVKKRIVDLQETMATGRKSWRFESPSLQFQHDVMTALVSDIDAFANQPEAAFQTVVRRLAQSRAIAPATLEGHAAALWAACRDRVRENQVYSGLDLKPQLGLLPLGQDPDSGLEEFLHWLTHHGEIPARNSEGKIPVDLDLGVVLVLIPGGSFFMGSQSDDASMPNFDANSQAIEQPVHEVTLSPYFLSKYELTQAQWQRAYKVNPSRYWPGFGNSAFKTEVTAGHPVERVSFDDAHTLLPRIDLLLPTEAEWERAARAGRTDMTFAGCSLAADVGHFANINGSETLALKFSNQQPGHVDDFIVHAPVGSFLPNAFGIYDMSGNVAEWCDDRSGTSYTSAPGPRGQREPRRSTPSRVRRGGHYGWPARDASVGSRDGSAPDARLDFLGLRPAKLITE